MKIILAIIVLIISSSNLIAQVDESSLIKRPKDSVFLNLRGDASYVSANNKRLTGYTPLVFLSAEINRNNPPGNNNNIKSILRKNSEIYFSLICHQDLSILIDTDDGIIPLCPRCMGLHIGFIISFIVLRLGVKSRIKISGKLSYIILFIGLGLIAIEWTLAQFSILQSSLLSRLLTGLMAGSNLSLLLMLYRSEFTRTDSLKYITLNSFHLAGLICMSLAGGILIRLSGHWSALILILLIMVTVNLFIIVHTIFLRFSPYLKLLNTK